MSTTESRAHAIARAKGYAVNWMKLDGVRRLIAYDPVTKAAHAAADNWAGMLRYLVQADTLGDVQARINASLAEFQAEIDRRATA